MKITKTKKMLKSQRAALRRFQHFLPVLELKKNQLQIEVRTLDQSLREKEREEREVMERVEPWVAVLGEDVDLPSYLTVEDVRVGAANIAGVRIPVLDEVVTRQAPVDYFATPPWIDDAIDAIRTLVGLRVEQSVLNEQKRLLNEELRITSQRVNLFEKVKIPETRENIRVIRIGLGDAQTAGVGRAKIAKHKGQAALSGTSGVAEA